MSYMYMYMYVPVWFRIRIRNTDPDPQRFIIRIQLGSGSTPLLNRYSLVSLPSPPPLTKLEILVFLLAGWDSSVGWRACLCWSPSAATSTSSSRWRTGRPGSGTSCSATLRERWDTVLGSVWIRIHWIWIGFRIHNIGPFESKLEVILSILKKNS